MINVPVVWQRDPRWGEDYLGFSWVKIKDYGCVISCITALANKGNARDTNNSFKATGQYGPNNLKGVYANMNLVVWGNVKNAMPSLELEQRANYYDNTKVADWVYNKKIPVIVQVDAGPIGSPRTDHYVLYIGDGRCMDPWTGRIRPTSDFPITKGAIFYKVTNLPLTCEQKHDRIKALRGASGMTDTQKLMKIWEIEGV